jgi:ParB-like chromosome segregation protein Spo0J
MNLVRVPIAQVSTWDKNPRGIKTKDFDRLKKQITKLGVYKPLVAVKENGGYVVLGGNMRLKALPRAIKNE